MVLLGLSGPVTQPTSAVPGGCGGHRRAGAAGWAAAGALGWAAGPPGFGGDDGRLLLHLAGPRGRNERLDDGGQLTELGQRRFVVRAGGLVSDRAVERARVADGLGIWKAWLASGCARRQHPCRARRWLAVRADRDAHPDER